MKKIVRIILFIVVIAGATSCDNGDNFWDPDDYVTITLNSSQPVYDFRTGKTYSYETMPGDIDNYGIINEPWCTDLPALCGNYAVTNATAFRELSSAPTNGYENNCLNINLNEVLVFQLGDGTYALVEIVNDDYKSTNTSCEHAITLHINYPAFVGEGAAKE